MAGNKFLTIRGLDEINRRLKKLDAKEGRKAITRAVKKALQPIRAQAQTDAPKKTGVMAKAIKIVSRRSRKGIAYDVRLGKKHFKGDEFYGAFQEFGWKAGPRSLGDQRIQIEGSHFMERAYEQRHQEAAADAERLILAEIETLLAGKLLGSD